MKPKRKLFNTKAFSVYSICFFDLPYYKFFQTLYFSCNFLFVSQTSSGSSSAPETVVEKIDPKQYKIFLSIFQTGGVFRFSLLHWYEALMEQRPIRILLEREVLENLQI